MPFQEQPFRLQCDFFACCESNVFGHGLMLRRSFFNFNPEFVTRSAGTAICPLRR